MNRRSFIQTGTSLAAVAALSLSKSADAVAAVPSGEAPPSIMQKPLPFNPANVPGLSEKILTSHYSKNYGGAVRRLNAISEELATLDYQSAPGFALNGLKREQLMALNAVILHEIYFAGLGEGGDPSGSLAAALEQNFGTVGKWHGEFSAMGKALGGGSGWVVLTYSPRLGRLENIWAGDHTMTAADGAPILALDMYEHSYHMDFGANAGAYVDTFMNAINWPNAQALFDKT